MQKPKVKKTRKKKRTEITVLGNSFVKFKEKLGTDQSVTDSARISYAGGSKGEVQDKKLMKYLLTNHHTSPFEQVSITFQIRMPIFIMRQFVRHRTFRLNEISARYTKLDLGFYKPEFWRAQDLKNKQGSVESKEIDQGLCDRALGLNNDNSFMRYEELLETGCARELARMVLPVNALTEIIVNCDLNNLMKFFLLRDDAHAQYEIQEISRAMKKITAEHFPWIMELYENYREQKEFEKNLIANYDAELEKRLNVERKLSLKAFKKIIRNIESQYSENWPKSRYGISDEKIYKTSVHQRNKLQKLIDGNA